MPLYDLWFKLYIHIYMHTLLYNNYNLVKLNKYLVSSNVYNLFGISFKKITDINFSWILF